MHVAASGVLPSKQPIDHIHGRARTADRAMLCTGHIVPNTSANPLLGNTHNIKGDHGIADNNHHCDAMAICTAGSVTALTPLGQVLSSYA